MPYPASADYGSSSQVVYTTTQTGLNATFDSPDQQVGQFKELMLFYNLSSFTGTSVTFKIRVKDAFGNYSTQVASSALSSAATGTLACSASANTPFGDTVLIEATANTVTSMTFTLTLKGK